MPGFSDRLGRVQVSATVQMSNRARELREQGKNVISLAIGEPNFATPMHAIEAAHQAALRGETKYPAQDGTRALKEAVQRKLKRENGLDYALDEIAVSNGGKQAIFNALLATVNDGDELIMPTPIWGAYPLAAKLVGGVPVEVPCPQNNGFKLRPEDLDAAITPRTKWLVLNFPSNPSGAACSRAEMRALADVLAKHPHVWIMADSMYEHLVYDGFESVSMAEAAPELRDRTLLITGVSKTYAMTGWRIGFASGPR
ncbi:MAG: pyridoxal phosphate-dependent aminotransferase, partial [Proteobacteria bacterium]|nr:pyridoxal phosphate-dependent aminotransferase [Pseudomonadota bacterium]